MTHSLFLFTKLSLQHEFGVTGDGNQMIISVSDDKDDDEGDS